ncbi:MAG: MarR family transcriptional regulator [Deltaproteobacteria bacterium]|nr:MarR family transcriptional regulator [Deltaproteobacteria bacterium]
MTAKKAKLPEKSQAAFSCADLEIEECPYYLLTRASLAATAAMKRRFSAAEIGSVRPAYLGSLMSLWREDGLKMIDLGRRAGLEPSTMTGLLDRMERDGLVERRPDPTDRRVLKIFLTPDGAAAREKVVRIVDETLSGVFSGIDADRIETFKKMMRQVLTNLREEKDDEPSE